MSTIKNKFLPVCKANQLIIGTGSVVVVTGWTLKETVAKYLEPSEYAAIGHLYSPTRGISLLVRNLLANPWVRRLVLINATKEDKNSGSVSCFRDFLEQGFRLGKTDTGQDCWLINSQVAGYLDREIEEPLLEKLRHSLEWRTVSKLKEAVEITKGFTHLPSLPPWNVPIELPFTEVVPNILPGPIYGHRIEGKTIAETWVKIIHRIKNTGRIKPNAYGGKWQELINLTAIVTDEPADFYFPEPNYLPCNRDFIQEYIPQVVGWVDEGNPTPENVYTYGQRLRYWFGQDQIEQVINKLAIDVDSARAVMSLWDVKDHESKSPPCLNHIWLRVVDRKLTLTATFRSNDMFSAWPANAMGLRALQQHICDEIVSRYHPPSSPLEGALRGVGALIIISQSAHIYDDCWENAENLIASQYNKICQQRSFKDPAGSFVISVADSKIVVEHMTPGSGEVVNCFSGKSAKQLYQQIAKECPYLEVEHALYLGTELQKAEISLSQLGVIDYEQDKNMVITRTERSN
ncbi:thymidylate synthase [Merismopedia glauca]|uniref:Thymidylate synthase n=1 Tax=Merismopedia glauca CCAP 1448/3 TaxID=1296344 RepID=A0A2T1C6S3_9CYAN|nr:thymidylate synthase [Merismopedia glauca]PSB03949.1 thymidylate synthase [Merismopedia glauca CCAP 1448/3]